jgi:hypothetical protein
MDMMNTPPLFADRIINIAVTGPLVRLELGVLQPPKAEGQQPQLVPAETLVMPLDGFAASLGMIDALAKKLIADGVLKQQPAATSNVQPPSSQTPQ